MKILKRIINSIKLWFTLKSKSNTESTSSIIPEVQIRDLRSGIEQEAPWFTRSNNLVGEFIGTPERVYSSNFSEGEMPTTLSRTQEDIDKDYNKEWVEHEMGHDDIELLKEKQLKLDTSKNKTIYLNLY